MRHADPTPMTTRRPWPLLAALLMAGCAQHGAPPDVTAARVQAALEGTPFSGAIVLRRGGEVVYARAFGTADHDRGLAFDATTAADGGSLAKTFTAAAVHLLVDEGRIRLDDAVQRHVPEYPHAATRVRHLLTHSAGLPDYDHYDRWLPPGTLRTTEAMLGVLKREGTPPAFAPGTRFEYSSAAFDVAALVVERVAGQPFARFLRERFFAPLGFAHSFARPAFFADWPSPRTRGHRWRDGVREPHDVFDGEAFVGGSNLYLSARDLDRWAAAFVQPGRIGEAARRASVEPARLDDGRRLALSWGSWYCDDERLRCQYSGHLNAFHGVVHWDRALGTTMVYISNHTLDPWLTPRLTRELVAAAAAAPAPPRDEAAPEILADAELPAAAGRYASERHGVLELRVQGRRLHLTDRHGVEYAAFRVTRRAFYVPGLDLWFGFAGAPPANALHVRSLAGDERAPRVAAAAAAAGAGGAAAATATATEGRPQSPATPPGLPLQRPAAALSSAAMSSLTMPISAVATRLPRSMSSPAMISSSIFGTICQATP